MSRIRLSGGCQNKITHIKRDNQAVDGIITHKNHASFSNFQLPIFNFQ